MQTFQPLIVPPTFSKKPSLQLAAKRKTRSLTFVDSSIQDLSPWHQAIKHETEMIVIDSKRSGVEQITEVLSGRCQISYLQIISRSCPGKLQLGNAWLDASNLEIHRLEIQLWQQAFAANTTVLLSDPTVAAGIEGMALIGQLSQLTGALVAVLYAEQPNFDF